MSAFCHQGQSLGLAGSSFMVSDCHITSVSWLGLATYCVDNKTCTYIKNHLFLGMWRIFAILVLGRLRQEDLTFEARVWAPLTPALRRESQLDLYRLKACQVYVVSSRVTRVTHRESLSQKQNQKQKTKPLKVRGQSSLISKTLSHIFFFLAFLITILVYQVPFLFLSFLENLH